MLRHTLFLAAFGLSFMSAAGCRTCCQPRPYARNAAFIPAMPNTGVRPVLPPAGAPGLGSPSPNLPPGAIVVPPGSPPPAPPAPPGTRFVPPAVSQQPPASSYSANVPFDPLIGGLTPGAEKNWQPVEGRVDVGRIESNWKLLDGYPSAKPNVQLFGPEPIVSNASPTPESVYKAPPATKEPPLVAPPLVAPPLVESKKPSAALPVGIPQFATVTTKIATGLRPMLEDGLDWLRDNGYRSVVVVHRPGEAIDADRTQAEKRGLKFLSFEVSPQTMTRAKLDEFLALAKSDEQQPIFVYDQDGALAGPLWYAYYQRVLFIDAEASRVRARANGLRDEPAGAHLDMLLAVQRVLSEN